MSLQLGLHLLDAVETGTFAEDGGAVFGPIPRTRWSQRFPPDPQNRVRLAARALIVRGGGRTILVDTGLGARWSAAEREAHAIEGAGIDAALGRIGVARDDVTDVVLSHLHFDHAGGATERRADGSTGPTFARATYHVQRRHWAWAQRPTELDAALQRAEDCEALARSGRLHFVEGGVELFPGVQIAVSEGHTVGMQIVRVASDEGWVTACAALIPTSAHVEPAWHGAFDLYPLTLLEEKEMLVAQALEDDGVLFLANDPAMQACRLREEDGALVAEPVELTRFA